jgi:hypothetical protein
MSVDYYAVTVMCCKSLNFCSDLIYIHQFHKSYPLHQRISEGNALFFVLLFVMRKIEGLIIE